MRELIDKLEQLDLQQLSMGDLRWMYCTGKGLTTGSGRDKNTPTAEGFRPPLEISSYPYGSRLLST